MGSKGRLTFGLGQGHQPGQCQVQESQQQCWLMVLYEASGDVLVSVRAHGLVHSACKSMQ